MSSLGLSNGSGMAKTPKNEDAKGERSAEETERIATKTLKNLLNTPPKPFTKPAKGKAGTSKKG
jgi:hypothetical protein